MLWSYNPLYAVTYKVWAVPRSLATTCGITVVFSSYAYLDVSVQRVRVLYAYPSDRQVTPFGNHRINSHLPIPGAYRSLSRPSSTLSAYASPVCPCLLSLPYCPFATVLLLSGFPLAQECRCCLLFLSLLVFFQYVKELFS